MYKVFMDEKVFFTSFNVEKSLINQEVKVITYNNDKQVFDNVYNSSKPVLISFLSDKKIMKFFNRNFKIISAGGGLVLNQKKEILMIHRNGSWDLPKGKIEKGEGKKEASIREVEEECGIQGPKIEKGLHTTYHTYKYKGKTALKQSFWYLMHYKGDDELIPQKEEGIDQVEWVSDELAKKRLPEMYDSIRDVLAAYWES